MGDQSKVNQKDIFSWSSNSIVNIPILFAVFGFIYSLTIIYSCFSKVTFQGVYIVNKDSLSSIVVNQRITDLNCFFKNNNNKKLFDTDATSIKSTSGKNSLNQFKSAKKTLTNSYKELRSISNGNTSLKTFAEYADINNDRLRDFISSLEKETSERRIYNFPIHIRDTCTILNEKPFDQKAVLKLKRSEVSLIDFFSTNSTFGFWFFLSVAQMCFWFLLIPLVIGSVKQTDEIGLVYNFPNALVFSIIPVIFISLFVYLLYWKLIDKNVIDDVFLMKNFNEKMFFYGLPGYFVSIICFSSFLFLSNNFEQLNDDNKSKLSGESQDELIKKYEKLLKAFNFTFICSTIVLTVYVFWIAVLFNAINETQIMQFYKLEANSLFLNYDFVYLIGLMHSLLLFVFYVPVKIRFSSLEISKEKELLETEVLSKSQKVLKTVLNVLSTILVTTSPLISTLLPKILETIS